MYQGVCPRCGREVAYVRMIHGGIWTVERDSITGARGADGRLSATERGDQARIIPGASGDGETVTGHPIHDCDGERGGRA